MTIIPNQFFGLGDVVFTQTLVRRIADGRPIVWPVFPQFVEGLNRAYPDILFVNYATMQLDFERKDQYEVHNEGLGLCTVLPIRFADSLMKVEYKDCMKAKYMMYGMDWQDWKEQAMWSRTPVKEFELHNEKFPATIDSFALVNKFFGSDGKMTATIPLPDMICAFMQPTNEFSLFDWQYIIEHTNEIHTVSTSIIYLLEMLDLEAKEVHLYPRKPMEQDFRNVDYLLQKHKYVLHA